MSCDVGPGTRLLCVEDVEAWKHMPPARAGTVYTCMRVYPANDERFNACSKHPDCKADGVSLQEFGSLRYLNYEILYCLACFRPLGGALPEEITRQLDVPFASIPSNIDNDTPRPPLKLPIKEPA